MRNALSQVDGRPRLTADATFVIGYGNRRRGDDAAGPLAIESLAETGAQGLKLEEFDGDGMALIELWAGIDSVVVIDAIASGRPPGSVFFFSADRIDEDGGLHCGSTHGLGLLEAVRLARTLGRLPRRLWVVGVESERFELGTEASQAVRRGARQAARLVAQRWGGGACTN